MSTTRRGSFRGDSRWLSVPSLMLLALVAAAAFWLSFGGLAAVSSRAGVPAFVLPLLLDGGILALGFVRAMLRGQRRRTWFVVVLLLAVTLVSSSVNLLVHRANGDPFEVVAVTALAPVLLLTFSEVIIYATISHDAPEKKPRRTPKSAPAGESAAASAPPRPVEQVSPRKPRAVASIVPAVDVSGMSEGDLLERARVLAPDPASRQRGTEESIEFRLIALALIDSHGWTPTTLASKVGDPDRNRIERVTRTLRQKLQQAA